ncbi:DNA-binding CsgD family transcriptional regulator [Pedobacter cryoconitis]|uniref:response regulator transcription factor n=1 Tax=Pedobacter cryoconitis TaxID=188932 RepID=UPI0016204BF3|nr:helix-turn-helix domain-containing protein [Pedobacter cryoconitis]MBB6270665.1 DNA-binding CsgD family transcriptional regulator [Pedobacter cryoconitis]
MNIINTLNEKLLKQSFGEEQTKPICLSQYQYMAFMYSRIENAIAVLSDMKANKSYIYNGRVAKELGFDEHDDLKEINSIWEEDIFNKIHPDDLVEKHLLELHYFNILKNIPISERSDYHVKSKIRMLNKNGDYIFIEHRMFYVCSTINGSLWLALCLYNLAYDDPAKETSDGVIFNSATGVTIKPDQQGYNNILSLREKEILQLIRKGKMSKEVAGLLSISINTVNRHRQNILEKLRVSNSLEACRIAERMSLI